MQKIWEAIKNYYMTLGENYHVDPLIFLGIHVIATPIFFLCVAWVIHNFKNKRSLVLPVIVSLLVFNAANIYLVIAGQNIPWWIYGLLIVTTLISSWFSYKKIREKMKRN